MLWGERKLARYVEARSVNPVLKTFLFGDTVDLIFQRFQLSHSRLMPYFNTFVSGGRWYTLARARAAASLDPESLDRSETQEAMLHQKLVCLTAG